MTANGNAIRTGAKRPLKRDVHISEVQGSSLVPRPPPVFCSLVSFAIIHGSGRAQKTWKAWEHLSRE